MKYAIATLAFLMMAAAGCTQVPPNPTVFSCPVTTGSAYTPLNAPNGTANLSYADMPTAGEYCYIAESVIPATGQVSLPSNTAGPFNVTGITGAKTVNLTWTAPTSGPAATGYVISRALAVASTLGAPVLGAGALADSEQPKASPEPGAKTLAMGSPINLSGGME